MPAVLGGDVLRGGDAGVMVAFWGGGGKENSEFSDFFHFFAKKA